MSSLRYLPFFFHMSFTQIWATYYNNVLAKQKDGPVGKNDVITTYLSETFFNRAWKGYDNNKMRSKAEREDIIISYWKIGQLMTQISLFYSFILTFRLLMTQPMLVENYLLMDANQVGLSILLHWFVFPSSSINY